MFRNLQISIFIYYFVTVSIFLGLFNFLSNTIELINIYIIAIILLGFVSYTGIILSNLAISPLKEHIANLQELSKETLHELNLPISTIKTNSQMLKKTLEDEKSLKRLSRIDTACEMLQQRYNELDYMIKTQTVEVIQENFDLQELVEKRIAFLSPLYPHIDFELTLEKTLIKNDSIGLSKAIDNLIDNAVKYSNNSTKVVIKLQNFKLSIQDYGSGINEVELLKIFDSYYQSDTTMKGFGIGLSLVKRFCDKNSIQLTLESKPRQGTTVHLQFKQA